MRTIQIINKLRRVEGHDNTDNGRATVLESFTTINEAESSSSHFSIRLVSAFTYITLLMYSSSAKLCFTLLHCVAVGDDQVLFIDGNIKCFQLFQYFLACYIASSILPFCLVPVLGSYLLKLRQISVSQFCIACFCPLPFCCYWMYLLFKSCSWYDPGGNFFTQEDDEEQTHDNSSGATSSGGEAVLQVLSGPFRSHKRVLCFPASPLPWEGFLIFRRLLLIVVLTFIHDSILKMIVALAVCIAILFSHMYVQPFVRKRDNLLESLSLSTLTFLCGLTLVKVLYEAGDFSSSSTILTLLGAFGLVEDVLIVTPLAIVILIVILSVFFRFLSCISLRLLGGLRKES